MNSFNWDDYPDSEEDQIPVSSEQASKKPFSWDEQPDAEGQKQEENILKAYGRPIARTGSRIAETILGLPGDIRDVGEKIAWGITEPLASDIRRLAGKKPLSKEKREDIRKKIQEEKNIFQKGLDLLPTSEELKKFSSNITSGFTDPQNAQEEFADDIVSLGTSILMGSKDPAKFKSFMKALGLATGAKAAGKGVELLGGTPKQQAAAEIGTIFLTSLISNRFADKFISEKYKKALNQIPKGTMLETPKLQAELSNLRNTLEKGLPKTSSTKTEVLKTIGELENKIAGGAFPAEELIEAYHDINEKISSKKLFSELSKPEQKKLRMRYDKVKGTVDNTLKDYGKNNPEFYNEWKEANQAYATLAKSRNAKDFILSNLRSLPGHIAASAAIKLFMGVPALTAAGSGIALFKGGKILNRVISNPSLRKYYLQVVEASIKENLPAMIKSLEKLDEGLKKEKSIKIPIKDKTT